MSYKMDPAHFVFYLIKKNEIKVDSDVLTGRSMSTMGNNTKRIFRPKPHSGKLFFRNLSK